MMEEDEYEFIRKRNEILNKFTDHFKEQAMFDPLFYAVFQILARGGDPYKIIEELINKCIRLQGELTQKKLDTINFANKSNYIGFQE